jgi:hypothetical protein
MESEIERLNKMRERIIEKGEKIKNNPLPRQEFKNDLGDEGYKPMTFTIQPNEVKLFNEWMGHIYGIYGKYGNFEFKFKSTGGLGYDIWVYSDLAKTELNLTKDVDY